ncbi:MAG TPA: DUF882 domain-containing protein [Vicinamibacterales bacterium]|nr:DUF882 domain-containing protein [Vicinamibacterales bacterium]
MTLATAAVRAQKFDAKTASFAIAFGDVVSSYREFSMFVLPGERVSLTVGDDAIQWTAPSHPGIYPMKYVRPTPPYDEITLRAIVLVPFSEVKDGYLNGYRIGDYPPPLKGNPIYTPPRGFVEVTKDNQDTKLSPHFELKQFICKEDTTKTYPKYLIVQERLLLKLEAILGAVNDDLGVKMNTLHVMSAYRTPFYNHAIGDVKYSMHQFGSAADIYIDQIHDSKVLYDHIETWLTTRPFANLQGGMGFYPATTAHPPFVHVDVRGTKARWRG